MWFAVVAIIISGCAPVAVGSIKYRLAEPHGKIVNAVKRYDNVISKLDVLLGKYGLDEASCKASFAGVYDYMNRLTCFPVKVDGSDSLSELRRTSYS